MSTLKTTAVERFHLGLHEGNLAISFLDAEGQTFLLLTPVAVAQELGKQLERYVREIEHVARNTRKEIRR